MKLWVTRVLTHPMAKVVLFLAALSPFAWLVYGSFANGLGANPAEYVIRATGDWTLRMLCFTLAVSPLRAWTGTPALLRFRRMLGLFVYFYVVMHFLSYSGFDMEFDLADIARDIVKRPFILVGFAAFVLLTPLAATSFNRAIRWMGARRWQNLHKAVYAIAGLGILHFFWMRAGKNNFLEVGVYALVLAVLLGWRLRNFIRKKTASGTLPRRTV